MTRSIAARLRHSATIAAVAACASLWAAAAPAQAASTTYCVQKPSCIGVDKVGVQSALASAQANPGPDRVEIGQGTFASSDAYQYLGSGANTLTLVGEGAGATRLVNTAGGTVTTLSVVNATVSDVEIVGPQGFSIVDTPIALDLDGTAHHVKVTGGYTGVVLRNGAILRDSTVTGSGLDYDRPAILLKGGSAAVLDTTVKANSIGVVASSPGHLVISRSSIYAGAAVEAGGGGNIDIDDSLIRGPDNFTGIAAYAYTKSSVVVATNVTIAGNGPAGGVGVLSQAGTAGKIANVVFQNSIVSGVKQSFFREASSGLAYITADHSAYDPTTVSESGAGIFWSKGGNKSASPGFVDPSGDFRLAPGSPLLDAGTATLQGTVPAKDRDGRTRSVDGNGDGTAVIDIGAYEFVPAPPDPVPAPDPPSPVPNPVPNPGGTPPVTTPIAPRLSRLSFSPKRFRAAPLRARGAKRGRTGSKLRFTLSKKARVRVALKRILRAGRTKSAGPVTLTGRAGANSVAFKGRVGKRTLKPGRYVARVIATDAGGRRSKPRTLKFTIIRA
jgi:uncharacterized membrane protein